MFRYPLHVTLAVLLWAVVARCAAIPAAEPHPGEKIYRDACAKCHGPAGEGTEEQYPHPLLGDRSVQQLTSLIATTMPEDKPGTCVGEEAEKVSAYIYEAFYSPAAQARNKPVRIELSRLTVRQYRHAVADLMGSFRDSTASLGEPGLSGEYYKSNRYRRDDRILERIDPQINFHFDESSPVPEKVEPREFSMRWEGAVMAPETGEYEFILQTENSARLWVNNNDQPLIDAWVKSGDDTEYRASISPLGGRVCRELKPSHLSTVRGRRFGTICREVSSPARSTVETGLILRTFARQEPVGLDRGQVEESEQDGGGHDDAPLVVHPGAMRQLQRVGDGGNPLFPEEVATHLDNPDDDATRGRLLSPPCAVRSGRDAGLRRG